MQIKNLDKWKSSYSEIGQSNPLRWQNLRMVEEGVFEPVSHKWKCKDFMNEVVCSWNTKRSFSIYGFSVEYAKFFNPDQTYLPILLYHVTDQWEDNLLVVNAFLASQGMPHVGVCPTEYGMVIFIPNKYLENTLFMSQVTLFIRLANTTKVYQSLEEMLGDPTNSGDKENFAACLKKPLKDFPEELEKYLWYYNEQQNCPKDIPKERTIQTSLMHNCGVVNWGWL